MTLDKNSDIKKVMSLKITIEDAARSALKNQEPVLLSTLRMLLAAMRNREIEKRSKLAKAGTTENLEKLAELTDEEAVEVIRSEVKKRREAIVEYEKGGRKDLADKESGELVILQKYMPQEILDTEIEKVVQEVVSSLGQIGPKDFGRVMGEVMKKLKGQASGDRVSKILKNKIG